LSYYIELKLTLTYTLLLFAVYMHSTQTHARCSLDSLRCSHFAFVTVLQVSCTTGDGV